ncbi:hypothetical protein LZP73_15870 [Shewanella sp. AS16]|uniref:hypothetical protein n=1 Tax=Shewanella sp. AS16 TaxID=2907625 RepID=UPI001F294588|nr:hypothetical protein [Shewanella sp. AS16]MCE9687666.1 hypothetical protein [Shewanella sp. AS16]
MSYFIEKNQVQKIKTFYRVFCFFICLCSLLGLFGALAFGTRENLVGGLVAALVPALLLYICLPIVFSGYPPKFLMWTLGKK